MTDRLTPSRRVYRFLFPLYSSFVSHKRVGTTAPLVRRMTESTLFTAYGADRRLAALAADPRPAFVWSIDGRELHWSNRAGAALLGLALHDVVRDGATLAAASLAPQIAAVGRGLARVD